MSNHFSRSEGQEEALATSDGTLRAPKGKEPVPSNADSNLPSWSTTTSSSPPQSYAESTDEYSQSDAEAFAADHPNVRFAILFDEIEGGALAGPLPYRLGVQSFFISLVKPLNQNLGWQVRKTLDFTKVNTGMRVRDVDIVVEGVDAGIPLEAFFNSYLGDWVLKVPMTACTQVRPGFFSLFFPQVDGGSLGWFFRRLSESDRSLPGIFLWALCRFFILCLSFLHFGWTPEEGFPPQWEGIRFGDYHGDNVLLDWSRSQRFRGLPRFRLCDFGFSRFIRDAARTGSNQEFLFPDSRDVEQINDLLWHLLNSSSLQHQASPAMQEFRHIVLESWPTDRVWNSVGGYPSYESSSDGLSAMANCPSTRYLVRVVLPRCTEMIERSTPMYPLPMSITLIAPNPTVVLVRPGEKAPSWVRRVDGKFRWVMVDQDLNYLGNVPRTLVPPAKEEDLFQGEIASSSDSSTDESTVSFAGPSHWI